MFLLYTQFGVYLLFYFHLNLFQPLLFKFFPTSQHDHTNILFWVQCLGGQLFILNVPSISLHLKLLAPFASLSYECLTLFPVKKAWHFVAMSLY